jgi:hypothetical protein
MPFNKATARAYALRRWATEPDRVAALEKARQGRMRRYYERVDPDGTLDPAERERRAQALLRADMILLAHKREEARRKRAAS